MNEIPLHTYAVERIQHADREHSPLWVVRVEGDDGELRPWHYKYVYMEIQTRYVYVYMETQTIYVYVHMETQTPYRKEEYIYTASRVD